MQHFYDWLNLIIRWFHLIAGIGWIGSSFYFMWLDSALEAPKEKKPSVEGELWMVHSGGFYQVEKRLIGPGDVPPNLHWFKWEAALTWVSGVCLLAVVFYISGGVYLVDSSQSILSPSTAVWASIAIIALSWFVYDGIWMSPLAKGTGRVASVVNHIFLSVIVLGVCQLFSGRAAFMHVGAIFGTLMVANVWVRILPAQQKMIDATQRGEKPDYELGVRAKRRSIHNSYMTFPVLFLMISNHFSMTWGHPHKEWILFLMIVLGAGVRHYMIEHSKKKNPVWVFVPVSIALVLAYSLTAPPKAEEIPKVRFSSIEGIIQQRCLKCHSSNPSDDVFKVAPNGVIFETYAQIKLHSPRILARSVQTDTMPMGNKTQMTAEERKILGAWIEQGSLTP